MFHMFMLLMRRGCVAAETSNADKHNNEVILKEFKQDVGDRDLELDRTKRGLVSIIVYGAAIGSSATAFGTTLAATLSGGCDPVSGVKSICEDRDAIDKIHQKILQLKKEFDIKFSANKKEFLDLRTASANNAYVKYYVDEAVKKVEKLADLQGKAYDTLQLQLPKLFQMYLASKNHTAEQYIEALVTPFEISISDIKEMVKEQQRNQMIGIGVMMAVDMLLGKLSRSYTKAKSQVIKLETDNRKAVFNKLLWTGNYDDAKVLVNIDSPNYNEIMKKHNIDPVYAKKTMGQKLKYTAKIYSKMYSNTKKFFSKGNLKKLTTLTGLKSMFTQKVRVTSHKMVTVKKFVTNSKFRTLTVKNFKLGWSQGLTASIGIIFDALHVASNKLEWMKVAKQLKDAKAKYQEYLDKLTAELASLKPEEEKMKKSWKAMSEVFANFSMTFKQILSYGNKNSEFNDVIGLPAKPVSSDNPFFKIDFNKVDKSNILTKQDLVIKFLKSINHDLKGLNEQFWARDALYKQCLSQTKLKHPIKQIVAGLKNIYSLNPSATIKTFGTKLTKKDTVCSISKVRSDLNEYDFFPLTKFRPRCEVSNAQFNTLEATATKQQNKGLLYTIVKEQIAINDKQPLSALLASVKNAYNNQRDPQMKSFGSSLTDQDVACAIAQSFKTLTEYNYISLLPFRPDCSVVTASKFATMKKDAEKKTKIVESVKMALNMCDYSKKNYCVCPNSIAKDNNVSEADVVAIMKRLRPKTKYCGTTGCACVNL